MSGCSRIEALLHSGEEMARLIAELHNLRMRVGAEARALARRHFAAKSHAALLPIRTGVRLR